MGVLFGGVDLLLALKFPQNGPCTIHYPRVQDDFSSIKTTQRDRLNSRVLVSL
ncbi:hypothetical protein LDL08_11575 [Nonomuraea glycinis]|uniref:hypothetical protein n=1 Tax=Nonomuraea glycinis TaxID=2047744 RepID=UPI00166BF11A|nr:hypothetical protein [Nonomuraea glycinis]MCA2176825.1 hypothetical protein [Nonomuraea glycinis]